METKKIDAYKVNARENANAKKTRNAAKIAVGDFLYLVNGYPMGIFGNIGRGCLNINFYGD